MSERTKLERKLKKLILEREQKRKNSKKYVELTARIFNLQEQLKNDDRYLEKDAKFNRDLCPIAGIEKKGHYKPSISEKGLMDDVCRFRDCPDFETCWATKSTKAPTLDLSKKENGKKFREMLGLE